MSEVRRPTFVTSPRHSRGDIVAVTLVSGSEVFAPYRLPTCAVFSAGDYAGHQLCPGADTRGFPCSLGPTGSPGFSENDF
jgi:hypothetical protein